MLIIRTILDSHSNISNYQYLNLHYFCPKNDQSDMIKGRPDFPPSRHLQEQCYFQLLVVGRIRLPRSSGTLEDEGGYWVLKRVPTAVRPLRSGGCRDARWLKKGGCPLIIL